MARFVYEYSYRSMYHTPNGSYFVYDTKGVVRAPEQTWEESDAKCICECWDGEDEAKLVCLSLNCIAGLKEMYDEVMGRVVAARRGA
jgi:hypothetical protein